MRRSVTSSIPEIDRADVAAGADRGANREDRAARELPPLLRDDDAGVGQEDQLAQDVSGVELAGGAVAEPAAAQRDESVDVRDPGRSDPVLHEPVLLPGSDGAPRSFDLRPVASADRAGASVSSL